MKANKKIDWQTGMEITSQTFIEAENFQQFHDDLNRKLVSLRSYGLIPKVKFTLDSTIIDFTLTIEEICCEAITKNGTLLNLHEGGIINLPSMYTGEYFVVAKIKEQKHIEINEIPYLETVYEYDLKQWADLSDGNLFPLLKIKKENEYWEKVVYIPPCIAISSCRELINNSEEIRTLFNEINDNIGRKKYNSYLMYAFSILSIELNSFTKNETPSELILLLKKIIATLLLCEPDFDNTSKTFLQNEYDHYDISKAFEQLIILFNSFKDKLFQEEVVEEKIEEETPINDEWCPPI